MSFLSKLGLRNWFKKTKQTAATRTHLNRPLSIESLETRITPVTNPLNLTPTAATISTEQGNGAGQVLHIVTTEYDDTLTISLANNILTVTFTPPTIPPAPVGTPRVLISTAAFPNGTLNKAGLVYTLDFSKGPTDFGGILVEMLHGNDTLNVNGLDFSALTTSNLVPLSNNLQVEFYGDRIGHTLNEEPNNTLNLSGNIASSFDDIVYQQWENIGGSTSTSVANISPVTLQANNQYSTTGNTGNYFHIFNYDQSGNGTQAPRPINVTGSPAFLVSGNGSINIDTTINIGTDVLFGYKTAPGRVDIISDAAQSNAPGGKYNINDNPAVSFNGGNLYIATSGIVGVNGLKLTKLNVYDTGDFTASRDLYDTTTNKLKPLAQPDPSKNIFFTPYDVQISGDLVFNSTSSSILQAKFNGNVLVSGNVNIYSYGTKTSAGSNISFGYSAKDHADPFYLTVSNNFFANSSEILTPTQIQTFNFPLNYGPTGGIYDLNIYDDVTTIGGSTSSATGTATFKNTGNLVIGSTDSVISKTPTFTAYLSIDGSKLARPDNNSFSSTKIFANITAGTDIILNGDLEVEAASGSNSFSLREFQVTAGKSQLRPSDTKSGKGNLKIDGTIFLRTTLSGGSNLILSAGSDDTNSNNIPDGVTFGTVNYISIFGVQGPGRTLTINQCSGFKSTQSVVLSSIIINKNELNANSGSGIYLFQGNLGLSLVNSGVNFISGKGLYNIRFEGADNYFDGVSQFKAFGRVVLGVLPSSVFHFENGASFDASLENSIVSAPIVCGTGFITGTSGSVKLNGATLAPGNFLDANGNYDSFGVLKFDIPLELNEVFSSESVNVTKGTYYPELVNNVPGTSQDAIGTIKLQLDGLYILYPVFRTLDILPGTKFTVVDQTSGSPIFNKFRGLTNQITNTYSTLYEGDTFYASGAKYTITYQGGDGNDVVITYLGLAVNGPETIVFVDQNNLLNIIGQDGTSDVTVQNSLDSLSTLQTSVSDNIYGLTGFAYGIKAFNNLITIPIGDSNVIGKGEFQGIKVEQNAGNDKLNLINLSFQDIALIKTVPNGNARLYVNTNYNNNIDSVSFSFDGGPSAFPSKDIDILNLVGTNRNIEIGSNNSATITIQGYDVIRSDNSTQVNDLYTGSKATQGSLFSANQSVNAFNIFGNISVDKGTLSFGTINRSDTLSDNTNKLLITGINAPVSNLVPLSPGTVTFKGSLYLGDGVGINFGDGKFSTNFQLQSISGTSGGLKSNITFNVPSNTQVYNGFNLNNSIRQDLMVSNIFGGNINVNGSVGTDIDSIVFTNSGFTNFYGTVDASKISIVKSDGNIIFYSQVGSLASPVSFEITQISNNFSLVFNDNLYASSFVSLGQSTQNNYSIKFLGSSTSFVNNTTLKNNGLIVLGDSNDSLNFNGGIQIESAGTQSAVSIFGKITSDGAVIKLEPQTITLTGDSSIQSNSLKNIYAASPITLSKIQSNAFTLTLNSGNILGSVIKIAEIYGSNGKLIINSSGGVDISKVGKLPVQNNVGSISDIFGSVIINDTIGDVVFSGPVLVNEILTTKKNYNVLFNGNSPANASYTTYVNSVPTYRWFYFVTGPNPTVFKNQGDVTFGVHGCDPQSDMDLFIFNGGVSTSAITGVTSLASRLYSVNSDINLGNTIMTESSFINTYFSSQVFNDLSGPTFLNPQIAQNSDVSSFPDFNSNEIINANILKSFGFDSNQLTSIGALSPPVQAFPAPYGELPYPGQTGDIIITSISNSAYYLHLNAGGLGIYGTTVGGNVEITTYTGGISDDQLGFYRGNNFTILNTLVANNLYIGTIANAEPIFTNGANYALSGFNPNPSIASPSLTGGIDLFGSVTIQSNFAIKKNFIVTPDVNNLFIMGGNNSWIANNTITNSGVLQLGNSASSVFKVSNNLNLQGPSIRRIGGKFNADPTKILDFGPGPITLIADTVLTTSEIGKTTLGQVTNNQFNLIVNGTVELQKYADDFSLAPYPSLTNPSSYIAANNFVGAGVGGTQNKGNVTFNDGIQVQDNRFFKLNTPILVNSGFSSATGNGIAAIGYTRLPEVVVSGGGGRGAIVNAVLGVPIAGFTGSVLGNTVSFQPQSIPTTRAVGTYSMFLGQPIDPYSPNPLAIPPNPQNLLVNSLLNNFKPATGTVVVAAVNGQNYVSQFTLTNINATSNLAGEGYTDLNNLYFVDIGQTTTANSIAVANPVVGGLVRLELQYPGAGYTSIPSVSVLNTTSGIVSNGTTSGVGFYGTNGAAPLAAINNGVTPNVIVNASISPATIATGNVIKIPTTTTLRKQGTGSVFLNSDSSATTVDLVTTIENGNFFFENAKINAATVTNVTGNGLLGGTNGTLGAVNILPRGQLSPGNLTNPIGVLNLQGNLSVQSVYKVDIRSVAFNLFDQVKVTGSVSLAKNNINGILDVAFTPDADVIAGNTFGIISNDGTDKVTGNFKTPAGIVLSQGDSFTVNMPNGTDVATFQISYTGNIATNGTASLTGGNDVVIQITGIQSISSALAAKSKNPNKLFAVSTDSGGGPIVKISFTDGSGFSFFAYDSSFTGGVRTAIGDVNGDGNPDLITAAGPGGGPHVIIWSITAGVPYATVQSGFFAFEPGFTGGITLATGNINGDVSSSNHALDDIIVGAGAGGGPRVKAFAGNANFSAINNQSQLVDFFAYAPEFNLGVNVAAGDRTGDGKDEIITGAAQGGGPHVQVWQISNGTANSIQSFFAFDPSYLCGVFVGSGDLDGDGLADIYTGTGSGPIGSVAIYFGNGAISRLEPFGSGFTGGVRVGAALGALNSNTNTYPPYLLTAAGPGGGPQVSLFDSNLNIVDAFFAFQENFTGGVLASTTVNT